MANRTLPPTGKVNLGKLAKQQPVPIPYCKAWNEGLFTLGLFQGLVA
jgi:hypothetical protein